MPKVPLSKEYLFYVASAIQRSKWRFNYGRKITPERLGKLQIKSPEAIKLSISFDAVLKAIYPERTVTEKVSMIKARLKEFPITELFEIERGQFHAIDRLEKGDYATVSRISTDNGVVGFFSKPKKAKVYSPFVLTVSTVTGDTFLQMTDFIATDNVLVLIPKKNYDIHTLLYIQAVLNGQKWRYSYGRQPYKRIFQKATVSLPIRSDGTIDDAYIKEVVNAQPYFQALIEKLERVASKG
jgi:hypothetical protein